MTVLDHLSTVAPWVFETSMKASILVGIILVIQALLRFRLPAKWHYALWFLLLLRLVMPLKLESKLSVFNFLPFQGQTIVKSENQEDRLFSSAFSEIVSPLLYSSTITTNSSQNTRQNYLSPNRNLFAMIWFIGVISLTFYSVIGNIKLFRRLKDQQPVKDKEIISLFNQCKKKMKISSSIKLVEAKSLKIPLLYGLIKPRVLLPVNTKYSLSQKELEYIFMHELAHHKRHDILIAWITALLQIFHWFNPVIWYAFFRMRSDRELACDESILSSIGIEKSKAYGKTIILLLEHISQKNYFPVTVNILETKKDLKRRLTRIAQFKKRSYIWSLIPLILLVSLGSLSLTDAKKPTDSLKPHQGKTESQGIEFQDSESLCSEENIDTSQVCSDYDNQKGDICNFEKAADITESQKKNIRDNALRKLKKFKKE